MMGCLNCKIGKIKKTEIPLGYYTTERTTGVIMEYQKFHKTGSKTLKTCLNCGFEMVFNIPFDPPPATEKGTEG